jgi:hypothetical protein
MSCPPVTNKVRAAAHRAAQLLHLDTVTAREADEFAVLRAVMQSSTVAGWRTTKIVGASLCNLRSSMEIPGRRSWNRNVPRGTSIRLQLINVEKEVFCGKHGLTFRYSDTSAEWVELDRRRAY